jgi:mannose-6-phosphate isomerase
MELLDAAVQNYFWGDLSFIPTLQGRVPSGEPEAELWVGTHPKSPSGVIGTTKSLAELIDFDPEKLLGEYVYKTYGQLPYVLKILAIKSPLSLQVHPSEQQAIAGYTRENNNGISPDDTSRSYHSPNEKSEIVCALTTFEAKFGFRVLSKTLEILKTFDHPDLGEFLECFGHGENETETLQGVVEWLLSQSLETTNIMIRAILERSENREGQYASELTSFANLAMAYPNDPCVIISLLLNHVTLHPGEALYVPPGTVHAYLGGNAVEITSNSDNVIRAGLTTKQVDREEFISIVDFTPNIPDTQYPDSFEKRYEVPIGDFALTRIDIDGDWTTILTGPEILISTDGPFTIINTEGRKLHVQEGIPVWVPHSDIQYTLRGKALVFRGSINTFEVAH